jgi:hypothetical protein
VPKHDFGGLPTGDFGSERVKKKTKTEKDASTNIKCIQNTAVLKGKQQQIQHKFPVKSTCVFSVYIVLQICLAVFGGTGASKQTNKQTTNKNKKNEEKTKKYNKKMTHT